jgi:low affinity Fe/Cu permease
MTLFIQRAETRDTLAIHAKLNELLRAENHACKELTTLDEQEPEEIARHRAAANPLANARTSLPAETIFQLETRRFPPPWSIQAGRHYDRRRNDVALCA